jgi:hypothetical protein
MLISLSSDEATAACSVRRGHERREIRGRSPPRAQPGITVGACRRTIEGAEKFGTRLSRTRARRRTDGEGGGRLTRPVLCFQNRCKRGVMAICPHQTAERE